MEVVSLGSNALTVAKVVTVAAIVIVVPLEQMLAIDHFRCSRGDNSGVVWLAPFTLMPTEATLIFFLEIRQ